MRKNTYLVSCTCGCGNAMECKILDGVVFISFLSGDFYYRQGLFNNIRERFSMFYGKKLIKDIIVNKEDLVDFRNFLLKANYEHEELYENDSFIHIDYDDFGDDFGIWLISTLSDKDILLGRIHRPYEIVLSKKERDDLVRKINKKLRKRERMKKQ